MRLKKLALMSMVVLATMSACGVSKKGSTDSTDAKTATEAKTDEKAPSESYSRTLTKSRLQTEPFRKAIL